jgi:hypothetical protein
VPVGHAHTIAGEHLDLDGSSFDLRDEREVVVFDAPVTFEGNQRQNETDLVADGLLRARQGGVFLSGGDCDDDADAQRHESEDAEQDDVVATGLDGSGHDSFFRRIWVVDKGQPKMAKMKQAIMIPMKGERIRNMIAV